VVAVEPVDGGGVARRPRDELGRFALDGHDDVPVAHLDHGGGQESHARLADFLRTWLGCARRSSELADGSETLRLVMTAHGTRA
jgi:hypothetical protein